MNKNPFGEPYEGPRRVNPFGDSGEIGSVEEAANRMDAAARKIRQLKTQMSAEGLSLQATRDLIDEVSAALDAGARALREISRQ